MTLRVQDVAALVDRLMETGRCAECSARFGGASATSDETDTIVTSLVMICDRGHETLIPAVEGDA